MSKKREPNFTTSECQLLTTLVEKYSNVLENKTTSAVTNKLKEETWGKLATDFNSSSGLHHGDPKILRSKYENIIKHLKKKYNEHRRGLYGTGGGPSQELQLTFEEEVVMQMTEQSIQGLSPRFDGDQIVQTQKPDNVTVADVEVMEVADAVVTDGVESDVEKKEMDIEQTPRATKFLLKHRNSTPLKKRKNSEAFNNVMSDYINKAKKNSDLLDLQIKSVEEKMKQEKLEHELKCKLLRLDIELKKQQLNKY